MEPEWKQLKVGQWFYIYCQEAIQPHTVAVRTDSGWRAVCAMTYANEAAEADAKWIVALNERASVAVN